MSQRTATVVATLLVLVGLLTAPALATTVQPTASTGVPSAPNAAAQPVDCSFPVTKTDATGAQVTVEEEPERVVVLGPSTAQTMWDIGAKEKVVGMPVNFYTAYLNGSKSRTNVVDEQGMPVAEKVVAANPDIVLAPNIIGNDTVESLRQKGLTVYRFRAGTTIDSVYQKTERTGLLVGTYEQAAQTRSEMQGKVEAIESSVENEENPDVYYVLGGGYTAGPGSYIHELITTAGGHNVAAEANITFYGQMNQEVLAQEDPEYIVISAGMQVPKTAALNESTAVQEDNIVRVNSNYLTQAGPRNVQPLKAMASAFHSDAYDASAVKNAEGPEPTVCESSVATDTPTDSPTPTDTPADATPTASDDTTATTTDSGAAMVDATETTTASGPGLGVPAAVGAVAVLAGTLVGRRRL